MAIVIGAATTVYFSLGDCVVSVNWGANPNTQRLYCIGSWVPEQIFEKPTENLSITIYAPGNSYSTNPTTSCTNANIVSASVNPASCGPDAAGGVSGDWFVTGYSFSKDDALLPGQESWSMTRWVAGGTGTPLPSYVLRGITEGQGTGLSGINFTGVTTTSQAGSVSAGGIGKSDTLTIGRVSSVGGGTSAQGETGQGSVSIPYTPLWV